MFFKLILKTMRPKQWYKNLILFAGLVFSLNLFDFQMFMRVFFAFVIFCVVSGVVYIINDIMDMEKDRKHPKKKNRPIASGKLSLKFAIISSLFLLLFCLCFAYFLSFGFFSVLLMYFFLMFFYSKFLKNIAFVDIIVVAFGFVLRAYAGTVVIDVPISPWLILTIFVLALFLATIKRMAELNSLKSKSKTHRKVFRVYDEQIINFLVSTISSLVILCYSLYSVLGSHSPLFTLTIPFVIYGIFRAYFLSKSGVENAEAFLKDKPFIINLFFWVLISVIVIYFADWVVI